MRSDPPTAGFPRKYIVADRWLRSKVNNYTITLFCDLWNAKLLFVKPLTRPPLTPLIHVPAAAWETKHFLRGVLNDFDMGKKKDPGQVQMQ